MTLETAVTRFLAPDAAATERSRLARRPFRSAAKWLVASSLVLAAIRAPRPQALGDEKVASTQPVGRPGASHGAGRTPLLDAILKEDRDAALRLIEGGADLTDARNEIPPLYFAAGGQNLLAVVKALVEKGAPLEQPGPLGTPLLAACYQGSPQVVEYLLSKGANLGARGGAEGYTSLHAAASGAVIVETKVRGRPTFRREMYPGRLDVVKVLLAHDADVNALSGDGKTPLDLVLEAHRPDLAWLILDRGGRTGEAVAAARRAPREPAAGP